MNYLQKWMAKNNSVNVRHVRLIAAGYVGVFLLAQLFSFEKFPGLVQSATGLGGSWATTVVIGLVIAELMALPFLLGLKTSQAVLAVSQVSGFVAIVLLMALEVFALQGEQSLLLGATLLLPSGAWSLLLLGAILVLMVWGVVGGGASQGDKQKISK